MPEEVGQPEDIGHLATVDVDPRAHHATELDEEKVLAGLFGPHDPNGFYRGAAK